MRVNKENAPQLKNYTDDNLRQAAQDRQPAPGTLPE